MREARHTGHKGRTMRYLFGHYILDTQRAELSGAGTPIKLRRQAFQVLAYLLRHRDRVVPKHELLAHLWPEQFVGDEALKSCVKTLRKALGEQGRAPHFVRTLYGQGYRFVAAVEERLPVPDAPPSGPVPCPALPAVSPPACPAASAPPPPLPLPTTGERQQATVLCGLLAHTTTLADQLGVAACRQLIQTFRTLAQECVQRYEGTMQPLGDEGMLALFGVPVAQEEHAWRAVQAALALQQRLRVVCPARACLPEQGLTACLGVHTGWVVAGSPRDEPPAGRDDRGGHDAGSPALAGAGSTGDPRGQCHDPAAPACQCAQRARAPRPAAGRRGSHHGLHGAGPGGPDDHAAVESLSRPAAGARGFRRPPGARPGRAGAGGGADRGAGDRQNAAPRRLPAAAVLRGP